MRSPKEIRRMILNKLNERKTEAYLENEFNRGYVDGWLSALGWVRTAKRQRKS